jgi:hypothetical protein
MEDVIKLRGSIEIALRDAINNKIVDRFSFNTVVTAGRRFVLEQINSVDHDTDRAISHMAVGTANTAPVTSDIALGNETTRLAVGTFTTSNLTSNYACPRDIFRY